MSPVLLDLQIFLEKSDIQIFMQNLLIFNRGFNLKNIINNTVQAKYFC